MTFDEEGDRVGKLRHSWDQVPKNGDIPVNTTISGTYTPTITATESGRGVQLGVEFTSGKAWFRDVFSGNIRPAQDLTGWTWSIPIQVGFAEILNRHSSDPDGIPQVVTDHLYRFTSQGFLVSRIFCDLQNIDLLGTTAAVATTDSTTKDVYKSMFAELLKYWLEHVKKNAAINPYILGYVPSYPVSSDVDADVPDSLKPAGNTFNVFFDPAAASRSTLNFIINTKASTLPAGSHPSTDTFDSNWLSPTDIGDGKMTFSYRSFVETLVLRHFYNIYTADIHQQISSAGIALGAFKNFDQAMTVTETGYHFDVYDVQGDALDQCKTYFDASFSTTSAGISVDIAGYIYWYKEKKKHVTILGASKTARAWAGGEMAWTVNIPITLGDGNDGKPVIEVGTPTLHSRPIRTWHDANGVAKDVSAISDLIGDIISVGGILTLFKANAWLEASLFGLNLLKLPTSPSVRGSPLNITLAAWSKTLTTIIILPGGQVFAFKQLSVDSKSGVVSMLVDYK